MQLVILHRVTIAMSILFCFGFGAWTFSAGSAGLGAFFVTSGVGLSGYLVWFIRKQVAPLAPLEGDQPSSRPPEA
jgi:hypothetical protein